MPRVIAGCFNIGDPSRQAGRKRRWKMLPVELAAAEDPKVEAFGPIAIYQLRACIDHARRLNSGIDPEHSTNRIAYAYITAIDGDIPVFVKQYVSTGIDGGGDKAIHGKQSTMLIPEPLALRERCLQQWLKARIGDDVFLTLIAGCLLSIERHSEFFRPSCIGRRIWRSWLLRALRDSRCGTDEKRDQKCTKDALG